MDVSSSDTSVATGSAGGLTPEPSDVTLRSALPEDELFLFELYRSTREDEIRAWGWDLAQQNAFLRMQFKAQQYSYETDDGQAESRIILLEDQTIGRLFVSRTDDVIQLMDIALLTEYRSKGIGTALIKTLIEEARTSGRTVRLHVLKNNRAARLYERLGFRTTGESGMHYQMEWTPGESAGLS